MTYDYASLYWTAAKGQNGGFGILQIFNKSCLKYERIRVGN